MRLRRALIGLSTLVTAAVLSACSATSGTGEVRLAADTPSASQDTTTPSTSAPAKETKTAPAKTAPVKPVMAAGVPCTITAKACVSLSDK